jgi:hypothetical protein
MKTVWILPLAFAVAGCPQKVVTADDFRGAYTGSLTETYTCANTSPPQFVLPGEELDIAQTGTDVSITINSCAGLTIPGDASGDMVNISDTGTLSMPCAQTDGQTDIEITEITGGTLQLDTGGNLVTTLDEAATIDGDDCMGTATGTLVFQP